MRRWPEVRRQRTGRLRRNVLRIREDPQQDEECFSDAGADELLRGGQSRNRAVREAPEGANALYAVDAWHRVSEESCEARERKKVFSERRRKVDGQRADQQINLCLYFNCPALDM